MKDITALQELIEWMDTNKSHCTYGTIRGKATELLTKEREQHYNSFVAGSERGTKDIPFNTEQYFDQTYKQP